MTSINASKILAAAGGWEGTTFTRIATLTNVVAIAS
jgi:hypothetical protein